jgi:DNA-binding CsgD family transcriptional regulator/tetratricopeptide (TPR) repeat protein
VGTQVERPEASALIGRVAELEALREALTEVPGPRAVVLEGEAGIGKTALWRAGVAEAGNRALRVLTARPVEAETALSHAALGDLLGPLHDEFAGEVPGPQRHALDVALLRTSPGTAAIDAHAVGAATIAVLRAATRDGPVVLAVDDVQWLDSPSARALAFALRRLGDEPVTLLATRRPGAQAESLELGLAEEQVVRVEVRPLDAEAIERMLQSRLEGGLSLPALARLAELSGGNPYYALELGRAALRQAGSGPAAADLPLPEDIHAVLRERLGALPAATRDALGIVAAMGAPTTAAATAVVDPASLDPAFRADVVHEEGETIRFDHPLLAEAAYRMLTPPRRRAVHELLADSATDVEERAWHLAAASSERDAHVAAEIAAGAEAAAARGAPSAAAQLLEASARVEPEAERAAGRRIDAVRHHTAAGDGRRSRALAHALVEELPPGPLHARALVAATEQEGPLDQMLGFARKAREEAGEDRDLAIQAIRAEALVLALQDRYEEALARLIHANELCGPETARAVRITAMSDYAKLAFLRGQEGAIELVREAAELEGDDLIPDAYWGPGMLLGRALAWADDLDAARPLMERRYRRALDAGDDESRAGITLHLAELEVRAGRLVVARRYADEGLLIQEASYGELSQGSTSYGRSLVAAHMGDVELARELGERGIAQSETQGEVVFAGVGRATLGFLELSLGDNAAALRWLSPVAERFQRDPDVDPGLPHFAPMSDAVEALIGAGSLEDAEALLEVWERVGERVKRPRVFATAARCRALLAAARGDLEAAVGHAEAALREHERLPVPLERDRTLIVLGSIHRRAKRKAAARGALDEALADLEAIGARLWADRARAELARIGGRARSGGLTPTEERVADLVAEGRSNKEVADALFVSVRTVEANLTRIYAKLGIRSRTELAGRRGR